MDEPDLPECHILTAGFPCQPFSAANRCRKGIGDARSAVIGSILQYIKRARPLIGVLENVIGILSWGHDVLVNIFSVMRELGYSIDLESVRLQARRAAAKSAQVVHRCSVGAGLQVYLAERHADAEFAWLAFRRGWQFYVAAESSKSRKKGPQDRG